MARKTVSRKKLRAEGEAAEKATKKKATKKKATKKAATKKAAKKKKAPKKKPKTKAKSETGKPKKKPRTRKKKASEIRLRLFWGVFNQSLKRVALYEFNQRKQAEKKAEDLTKSGKSPHFVQRVKEEIDIEET